MNPVSHTSLAGKADLVEEELKLLLSHKPLAKDPVWLRLVLFLVRKRIQTLLLVVAAAAIAVAAYLLLLHGTIGAQRQTISENERRNQKLEREKHLLEDLLADGKLELRASHLQLENRRRELRSTHRALKNERHVATIQKTHAALADGKLALYESALRSVEQDSRSLEWQILRGFDAGSRIELPAVHHQILGLSFHPELDGRLVVLGTVPKWCVDGEGDGLRVTVFDRVESSLQFRQVATHFFRDELLNRGNVVWGNEDSIFISTQHQIHHLRMSESSLAPVADFVVSETKNEETSERIIDLRFHNQHLICATNNRVMLLDVDSADGSLQVGHSHLTEEEYEISSIDVLGNAVYCLSPYTGCIHRIDLDSDDCAINQINWDALERFDTPLRDLSVSGRNDGLENDYFVVTNSGRLRALLQSSKDKLSPLNEVDSEGWQTVDTRGPVSSVIQDHGQLFILSSSPFVGITHFGPNPKSSNSDKETDLVGIDRWCGRGASTASVNPAGELLAVGTSNGRVHIHNLTQVPGFATLMPARSNLYNSTSASIRVNETGTIIIRGRDVFRLDGAWKRTGWIKARAGKLSGSWFTDNGQIGGLILEKDQIVRDVAVPDGTENEIATLHGEGTVAVSRNGTFVYIAEYSEGTQRSRVAQIERKRKRVAAEHRVEGKVQAIVPDDNGTKLLVCSKNSSLPPAVHVLDHDGHLHSLPLPAGVYGFLSYSNRAVTSWSSDSTQVAVAFTAHETTQLSNGKVVSISDSFPVLASWNTTSGQIQSVTRLPSGTSAVEIAADRILIGTQDGEVNIVKPTNAGDSVAGMKEPQPLLTIDASEHRDGFGASVVGLQVTASGQFVTTTADGELRLYRLGEASDTRNDLVPPLGSYFERFAPTDRYCGEELSEFSLVTQPKRATDLDADLTKRLKDMMASRGAELELVVQHDPGFYPAYVGLGHMAVYRQKFDRAESLYEKALEIGADYLPAKVSYDRLMKFLGKPISLEKTYRAAVEDGQWKYRMPYAELLIQRGEYAAALKVLDDDNVRGSTQYLVTQAHIQLGQFEEALPHATGWVEVQRQFVQSVPGNMATQNLARALSHRGFINDRLARWEDAVVDWEEVLALSPHEDQIIRNLSWLLSTCHKPEIRDPKRSLKLAMTLDLTADPDAHLILASALARAGNAKEAMETLKAAFAADGQFALKNRKYLRMLETVGVIDAE